MSRAMLLGLVFLAAAVPTAARSTPQPSGGHLKIDTDVKLAHITEASVVVSGKTKDFVVQSTDQLHSGGEPYYLEYKQVEPYFEMILYFITGCFVLFVAVLTGCCVYDSVAHWRHLAYFRSCITQVQRVHDIFLRPQGELPLCPICIEKVSTTASSTSVVFLCGHRYHTECANQWYLAKPRKGGRCPICNESEVCSSGESVEANDVEARVPPSPVAHDEDIHKVDYHDEAKSFFLRSLMRQFPEFITEECVRRWTNCHPEIWLSELDCPRYRSIFTWRKKGAPVVTGENYKGVLDTKSGGKSELGRPMFDTTGGSYSMAGGYNAAGGGYSVAGYGKAPKGGYFVTYNDMAASLQALPPPATLQARAPL